jgi:hypothetical protein
MAIRHDTVSRNGQYAQWMAGTIDLRAPILVVSHFAFGPSGLTPRSQASLDAPSSTAPL